MLCATCNEFIIKYYAHRPGPPAFFAFKHNSLSEVKSSARAGCAICGFICRATKEAQYEYNQWINGVAGHQSTVYWSSLKLDFYAPGKWGAIDGQLPADLDACDPNSPLNKYGVHDPGYMYDLQYDLPPRTDDDNCFELARTWINSCVHSHRRCVRLQDTRLPSRVLDVGIHNSPRDPYIWRAMASAVDTSL